MSKSNEPTTPYKAETPMDAVTQLQEAGFTNLMGMSTAWLEAIGEMQAEVASFVAERIKQDVKTQHEMLNCKNMADLQHIQAQFIQKAMDQYQAETGKLVEMSTKAFQGKTDK